MNLAVNFLNQKIIMKVLVKIVNKLKMNTRIYKIKFQN